jgi:hypothetical protein
MTCCSVRWKRVLDENLTGLEKDGLAGVLSEDEPNSGLLL